MLRRFVSIGEKSNPSMTPSGDPRRTLFARKKIRKQA